MKQYFKKHLIGDTDWIDLDYFIEIANKIDAVENNITSIWNDTII